MKTQIMQKVLPCYLTPEELQTESQVLVGLLQKKSALEDEKKSTNSMYAERIKTVEEKIENQMPIVQYGRVDRLVDIKVEFHTPDKNLKQLTRLDTQTIIEICPMSNDELEDLFINAEEPQETTAETAPVEEPAEQTQEEIIDYIPEERTTDLVCEPGKLYRFRGITGRGKVSDDGQWDCIKCVFGDDCPVNTDPKHWDCGTNHVTFIPYHTSTEQAGDDANRKEEETLCSCCGAINTNSGNKILHVFGNKPVCRICLAKKNEKYFNQVLSWDNKGHQVLFRSSYGFGCTDKKCDTTCFRFMGSGHSWGCPVYKEGDYETPGTEAADFYAELNNKENFKED